MSNNNNKKKLARRLLPHERTNNFIYLSSRLENMKTKKKKISNSFQEN